MASKYSGRLKRVWGTEKIYFYKADRPKDKNVKLHKYITDHDFITQDVLDSLSYANTALVLKNYTKRHGIGFEYIGNDTWVILK
jgi:hypothetical protein